jgi:hypothetical protein
VIRPAASSRTRPYNRWEPLYEATQIKGDGESHKFLSPNDEFASYEIWDKGNLNLSVPKRPEMLQYEYARAGLKLGLKLEQKVGVNPYKFSMIGSTDSHTGLATAEEDNFFGKHSGSEPGAKRWEHPCQASAGKVPTFLVAALKDPIGANLDRIQIIKGWLDAKGDVQEKVYDVVWSDSRKPGADGKLPPVGNTVDVANAVWTNTIGAPELITVWKDPGFDPALKALYYARVIEIPTPRWTAYDAKYYGGQDITRRPHDYSGARL